MRESNIIADIANQLPHKENIKIATGQEVGDIKSFYFSEPWVTGGSAGFHPQGEQWHQVLPMMKAGRAAGTVPLRTLAVSIGN
jgi:hypothetical protein